jgi:hypothetical protein
LLEKAGNLFKSDKLAEKGSAKRDAAGGDEYGSGGNTGSGDYGSGNNNNNY